MADLRYDAIKIAVILKLYEKQVVLFNCYLWVMDGILYTKEPIIQTCIILVLYTRLPIFFWHAKILPKKILSTGKYSNSQTDRMTSGPWHRDFQYKTEACSTDGWTRKTIWVSCTPDKVSAILTSADKSYLTYPYPTIDKKRITTRAVNKLVA